MCNLPVQGICADCMMRAIALRARRAAAACWWRWCMTSCSPRCRKRTPRPSLKTLKACLHRAFVETFPGAPTLGLVDAHVGAHWAEVH